MNIYTTCLEDASSMNPVYALGINFGTGTFCNVK